MPTTFNHFHDYAERLRHAGSQLVVKAALDIEAAAKGRAPVATGFLRASIYTKTHEGSSYANEATGGPGQALLPELEEAVDEQTAYVGVGASYGLYVEYGTRHAPAQPFLVPAVEQVRQPFQAAFAALEEHLGR